MMITVFVVGIRHDVLGLIILGVFSDQAVAEKLKDKLSCGWILPAVLDEHKEKIQQGLCLYGAELYNDPGVDDEAYLCSLEETVEEMKGMEDVPHVAVHVWAKNEKDAVKAAREKWVCWLAQMKRTNSS